MSDHNANDAAGFSVLGRRVDEPSEPAGAALALEMAPMVARTAVKMGPNILARDEGWKKQKW